MAAIDNIRKLAQKTYYSINGAQNDDTDDDLTTFENDFICYTMGQYGKNHDVHLRRFSMTFRTTWAVDSQVNILARSTPFWDIDFCSSGCAAFQ